MDWFQDSLQLGGRGVGIDAPIGRERVGAGADAQLGLGAQGYNTWTPGPNGERDGAVGNSSRGWGQLPIAACNLSGEGEPVPLRSVHGVGVEQGPHCCAHSQEAEATHDPWICA